MRTQQIQISFVSFAVFFYLLSFNINSMKAFPKLSDNDVAQGRSFSLYFQSAELAGETIPSLISIAVH